ncbi:MAG: hypothetical protein ACREQ7_09410 [Candidatus Binatia bacterium]
MPKMTLELPEEVFSALRRLPEEFVRDLRLAAGKSKAAFFMQFAIWVTPER